mgnify:CR=1 FL=1
MHIYRSHTCGALRTADVNKDVVLLEQPYAKDDSQSVQKFIGGASIVRYAQVEIG